MKVFVLECHRFCSDLLLWTFNDAQTVREKGSSFLPRGNHRRTFFVVSKLNLSRVFGPVCIVHACLHPSLLRSDKSTCKHLFTPRLHMKSVSKWTLFWIGLVPAPAIRHRATPVRGPTVAAAKRAVHPGRRAVCPPDIHSPDVDAGP